MVTDTRWSGSGLAGVPPVTGINLVVALLALPVLAWLTDAVATTVSPLAEVGVQLAVAGLVVGVAVGVEGHSLSALGFRRPDLIDVGYLLATAVVTLVVFVATDPLIAALGLPTREGAGTMETTAGLGVALAGAVTTGIVEEVLFRGYPIERLLDGTGSPLVAGGLPWGVFTVAHAVNWPLGDLLQVALVAAVLTVVYLRRRTLVPVVGAHVLVWVFATLGQFYG